MELRQLRSFLSVAACGTISKAAEQLHISQPALSRQIHDLQARLGIALFERVGRNVQLTGAGEDLLAYARTVLVDVEALAERARLLGAGASGVLRVGATPQTLERLFPPLLERFSRMMPAVEVRLTEGTSGSLIAQLERGELHLALATYHPEMRSSSRILAVSQLYAVSKTKLGRAGKTIDVRELTDIPLLLLHRGFGSRDLFDAACYLAHVRPNIILESSAYSTLLALARSGHGVAIMPATISIDRRSGLTIKRIAQQGNLIQRYFAVHWSPRRYLPPYAERFIEALVDCGAKTYGSFSAQSPHESEPTG